MFEIDEFRIDCKGIDLTRQLGIEIVVAKYVRAHACHLQDPVPRSGPQASPSIFSAIVGIRLNSGASKSMNSVLVTGTTRWQRGGRKTINSRHRLACFSTKFVRRSLSGVRRRPVNSIIRHQTRGANNSRARAERGPARFYERDALIGFERFSTQIFEGAPTVTT